MNRFQVLSAGLRRKRGEMNKNEARYAEELEADQTVYHWWFQPLTLRLSHPESGQPAKFTPDFLVLMADGTTYLDDVKSGGGFDDLAAGVRIKTAAELYPLWRFRLVEARKKKDGGGWKRVEV